MCCLVVRVSDVSLCQLKSQYWLDKGARDVRNCCHQTTHFANKSVFTLNTHKFICSIWIANLMKICYPSWHTLTKIIPLTFLRTEKSNLYGVFSQLSLKFVYHQYKRCDQRLLRHDYWQLAMIQLWEEKIRTHKNEGRWFLNKAETNNPSNTRTF